MFHETSRASLGLEIISGFYLFKDENEYMGVDILVIFEGWK